LYQGECKKVGIEVLVPDSLAQARIMDAILKIKEGAPKATARKTINREANRLLQHKAEALILGCTELSVVFKANDFSVPVFDSNWILAEATVKFARSDCD